MTTKIDSRFARRGLILVFITLLLDIIGIAIIVPVMPKYLSELTGDSIGAASVDGGYLFMAYAGMQFLFAPMVGNLSDRFGRRPVLLISIITFAIDNLICAVAWSFSMLFAGRLLAGISGASFSTCSAYIADISDDSTRTRNFGLVGIAFGTGFILGPFIGGLLGEISPRAPFYAAAALSFVNFIFAYFILPETLPKRQRRRFDIRRANPLGALLQLRKYPSVSWVAVAFFLYWLSQTVWPVAWAFVANERYHWSAAAIGLSYGVFGIGQIFVMALILPLLAKHWSDWKICMVGLAFALVGIVGYTFAFEGWMIFVVFALTFPEYLANAPMRAIAAAAVPPNAQGELQGALTSLTSLTSIIGAIVYPYIFKTYTEPDAPVHFSGAPYAAAFFMLLAAVLVFFFKVQRSSASTIKTVKAAHH